MYLRQIYEQRFKGKALMGRAISPEEIHLVRALDVLLCWPSHDHRTLGQYQLYQLSCPSVVCAFFCFI